MLPEGINKEGLFSSQLPKDGVFQNKPWELGFGFSGGIFAFCGYRACNKYPQQAQNTGLVISSEKCYNQVFICSAEVQNQDVSCWTSVPAVAHDSGKQVLEFEVKRPNLFTQHLCVLVALCRNWLFLTTEVGSASLQHVLQGEENEKTDCGTSNE